MQFPQTAVEAEAILNELRMRICSMKFLPHDHVVLLVKIGNDALCIETGAIDALARFLLEQSLRLRQGGAHSVEMLWSLREPLPLQLALLTAGSTERPKVIEVVGEVQTVFPAETPLLDNLLPPT